MTIEFAREELTDALWDEAFPLLLAHWREVAHFKDIDLSPDRQMYRNASANGAVRCFTARSASGAFVGYEADRLLGYCLFFVRSNPHYSQSVQAVQDVIYLDPSVRGGTGYKFIAWCDQQLALEGVEAVYQHVKASKDFGPLLERQGYELVDKIYAKRLNVNVARGTSDLSTTAKDRMDDLYEDRRWPRSA